jgi:hypothetical protein
MFFDARALFFGLLVLPALIFAGPGIKGAAADTGRVMSEGEYEEALAFIEGTKAVMAEAEAALGKEVSRPRVAPQALPRTGSDAEAQRDDLSQRLDMLRRLMTAAAQRDRIGAKDMVTPERERARDVIARAGAIEDPLQDLWTAWSMRSRGVEPACPGRKEREPCWTN